MDFQPKWRCRWTHCASSHNQKDNKFKNKNQPENQQQKIELYLSLTTNKLRKKHSPRSDGGAETAARRRGLMARQQLEDRAVPHSSAVKLGGTTGERNRPTTQGSSTGKLSLKSSDWKHLWRLWWRGQMPSLTGELVGETHRALECTQTH